MPGATPLKLLDKTRGQGAQSVDVDATGPRDVAHGKFDRRELHVLGEVLVPGRAPVGTR